MKHGQLAWRLLKRDARSGELTLLVLALLIAVASTTTITLFADRLQRTLTFQAAEFLAGDLVIASSAPIAADWLQQAHQQGLTASQTTEFSSVLLENQQMLLVAAKAVSANYPLRGTLKTHGGEMAQDLEHQQGPAVGEAWVENRVLSALQLRLGDWLQVGEKSLQVSQILSYEPDKRGDFYSFSPRVMINQQDLAATGVIQPGSHVHYFYQFIGEPSVLLAFKQTIKPQLNASQRILDIHEDRPELGAALQRAERYLGLSSIVVILIAGVGIAMSAARYTERHFDATALLKCLGCQQKDIIWLYGLQFFWLGLIASALGCALGWGGQWLLFELLKAWLPQTLLAPGLWAIWLGFLTGMIILLGFALPPLLRLQSVAPVRVLRRELAPMPTPGWLVYGLALAVVAGLIGRYSGDWRMTGSIIGVGLLVLLLLGALLALMLRGLRRLLAHVSLTWRFGLQGWLRHGRASISQILAFSLTLAAMSLSWSVRNDLLAQWQQQLPAQAPNHFALNIIPDQLPVFRQDLQNAGIQSSQFYPVVRGRLVAINAEPVQRRVSKDSQGEAATQRELSLTFGESLPEDNRIVAGQHWPADQPGYVSVEQKLAENLHIQVGDRLQFTVGSAQISAEVANLRSLRWDSMKPNFYMVFSPGTLDAFPTTYLTSFYLSAEQKSLLNGWLKRYPAITVLEVDQILRQFKTILQQLTQAVDVLLYFALAAGLVVLMAAVYATLDQRIHEAALLRTLGAKRRWLSTTHIIEFASLGALAGGLAVCLSQAILVVLYTRMMQMTYQFSGTLALGLPLLGAVLIGAAGFWGVREVVRQPPMRVLRRV